MNEIINFNISEIHIISIVILGLLLFFLLKMIKRIFIIKLLSTKHVQYYFLAEVIVWIIFGVWTFKTFFKDSIYYSIGLLTTFAIISVWLAWFVVKDFIAGIVFRLNANYQKGQLIKINEKIAGYIEKINYLNLELSTIDGDIISIPYSRIQGSIYQKSLITKQTKLHTVEISLPKKLSLEKTKENIRKLILISAGVNTNKEPQIILKKELENEWILEINVYLFNENYINLIDENIKKAVV